MATSLAQLQKRYQLPDRSGEQHEYIVWVGMTSIKLRWDEMTLHQKLQQIQAEEREAYVANFDPCGILF